MLNPFPDLLAFSFFAPTIIRLLVAAFFIYSAYWHSGPRADSLFISALGYAELIIGVLLFVGLYTQIATLCALGVIIGIAIYKVRNQAVAFVYANSIYILLAGMCLSLLVSGAGAIAFDIPL